MSGRQQTGVGRSLARKGAALALAAVAALCLIPAQAAQNPGRPLLLGLASKVTPRGASLVLLGGFQPGKGLLRSDAARAETRVGQTFYLLPTDWSRKPVSGRLAAPFPPERGLPTSFICNGAEYTEPNMLAVAGEQSRAFPRGMQTAPLASAAYVGELKGLLKTLGQSPDNIRLRQHLTADLDGDGSTESLLIVVAGKPARVTPVLRYTRGGRARFHTFVLPGERADFLRSLDLDGDGKMEIVLFWAGKVGRGVQIWRFEGSSPAPMLEISLPST
jgi:hypothetical protein